MAEREEAAVAHRNRSAGIGGPSRLLEPGLWDHLRLGWRLFRDPRVASRLKVIVPVIAGLYLVSPIDVIPDLFLGVGQVDDLGVIGISLLVLARLLPRFAPPDVVEEHRRAMGHDDRTNGAGGGRSSTGRVLDAEFRIRE